MKKILRVSGKTFTIEVKLNAKVDGRLDGKRWHTITVTCAEDEHYRSISYVEDKYLIDDIKSIEENLNIDKDIDTRLIDLGYK